MLRLLESKRGYCQGHFGFQKDKKTNAVSVLILGQVLSPYLDAISPKNIASGDWFIGFSVVFPGVLSIKIILLRCVCLPQLFLRNFEAKRELVKLI